MGCGYTSQLPGADRADTDSQDARPARLAVLAIRNDSPEPWLDRLVGDALRREVSLRSAFDLVDNPERAALVLRGRVQPLVTRSNSFSSFVAALEYSVTMTLDLEVVRDGGTVVRLDPAMLSETELYLASADIEVTRTRRLEALRHLSDVLSSRAADAIELMESPISLSRARSPVQPALPATRQSPPESTPSIERPANSPEARMAAEEALE